MKKIKRLLIRFLISFTAIIALGTIIYVIITNSIKKPEVLNVITGAMAVLTACIAAYSSIKVIEESEDNKRAKVVAKIDYYSIPQLVQIEIKNIGFSQAQNVQIKIKEKESISKNQICNINEMKISNLLPNESHLSPIDTYSNIIKETSFITLIISYNDFLEKYRDEYVLSFAEKGETTLYKNSGQEMQEKIMKIPEKLDAIAKILSIKKGY